MKFPARCNVEQIIVRNAAPKEERQAGGQLQVVDAICGIRRNVLGIPFDPEQELGTGDQGSKRHFDTRLEACLGPGILEKTQRHLKVRIGDRASIGTACQR